MITFEYILTIIYNILTLSSQKQGRSGGRSSFMNSDPYHIHVEKYPVVFGQACKQFLSFSLQIREFGRVTSNTDDPHGEYFVHYHRLNYILEGHPYFIDHNRIITLEPGCLVYMPPNTALHLDKNAETLKLIFINFDLGSLDVRETFYQFMETLFPDRHVHDRNDELKNILYTIYEMGIEHQPGVALEIPNLFEILFLHIFRMSQHYPALHEKNPATGSVTILEAAMDYINANLSRPFRISEMAAELNISENYLYKVFVKKTGDPPTVFIKKLRIDLAKSSLSNPNLSIKVIADHLGYENVSQFSSVFKREVGESPASYRRNINRN